MDQRKVLEQIAGDAGVNHYQQWESAGESDYGGRPARSRIIDVVLAEKLVLNGESSCAA